MLYVILSASASALLCSIAMLWMHGRAKTRLSQAETRIHLLQENEALLREEITSLRGLKDTAERESLVIQTRLQDMQTRMGEWEQMRTHSLEHAKAAIFEASNTLSKQLMEVHKQETEVARKSSEERFAKATGQLHEQFQTITSSVSTLREQMASSSEAVTLIKQALLSPTGAGALAEITLSNILKASGLKCDRDYVMQHTLTGAQAGQQQLRPDVIVFLPVDDMLVIDSKASVFFLQREGHAEKDAKDKQLIQSMRTHLRQLSAKEYRHAAVTHLKTNARTIRHSSVLMFVPTDAAVQLIDELDPHFMRDAWALSIFPVGPAGLMNILSHARFQIMQDVQVRHHEEIIEEIKKLLQSIGILHEHGRLLGKGLHSAIQHYDKFSRSFNQTFLRRARRVSSLGLESSSKAASPLLSLPRLQVVQEEDSTLDLEEENVTPLSLVES